MSGIIIPVRLTPLIRQPLGPSVLLRWPYFTLHVWLCWGRKILASGLCCSKAHGIFLDQGSNPRLPHWRWILIHCTIREGLFHLFFMTGTNQFLILVLHCLIRNPYLMPNPCPHSHLIFSLLIALHSVHSLSSPTKDQTLAPCIELAKS